MDGIGVSNLPNQHYRHILNKGISYNILIIGEKGLGKSSFINMLLDNEIIKEDGSIKVKMKITERDFNVNFSVTEINTEDEVDILEIIKKDYLSYMEKEKKYRVFEDNRKHVCLYFFEPSGIHLKPKDLEIMKKISEWCNLIPIVAKGDSYTMNEITLTRENIGYVFEDCFKCEIYTEYPLFVISQKMREYLWGTVYSFDAEISDTSKLKRILVTNNLIDLVNETEVFYNKFKNKKLVREIINNFCENEKEKSLGESFLEGIN